MSRLSWRAAVRSLRHFEHPALHPQFRNVNTVLDKLKTAISGTYHAFDLATYADRHLAEVRYRFNR